MHHDWTDDNAKAVRDVADIVKAKLADNCDADVAQLGVEDMQLMLEHLQTEFRWEICVNVFEACAEIARKRKAQAFGKAVEDQERLQKRRRDANESPRKKRAFTKD